VNLEVLMGFEAFNQQSPPVQLLLFISSAKLMKFLPELHLWKTTPMTNSHVQLRGAATLLIG